ncbi:MAG: TonB-dependent receptor [Nevskia sp.]|nr:TonB-dependent receptor [Nevskia sp.]
MTKLNRIQNGLECLKLRQPALTLYCAPLALAAALVAIAPNAHAQLKEPLAGAPLEVAAADTPAGTEVAVSDKVLEEIVVTGSRGRGLQASETLAPVQVLSAETLKSAGQPDLIGALAQIVPSFTAQSFGGDQANQTLSAKLRGVSPNHALVLINGKRRHTTANLAVLGGPFQGAATADLNFIPVSSIKRIEVLTDGAAAQYGTDAIAGVINIILKDKSEGGSLDSTFGAYKDGGGETKGASGNIGFGSGPDAFINLTGEIRKRERSDRGGIDPRVVNPANLSTFPNSNLPLVPGYPYLNQIQGDPEIDLYVGSFNAGYTLGDVKFYSVGTYGIKKANSFENYRLPSRASYTPPPITDSGGDTVQPPTEYFYPFGFNPREATDEEDFAATFGVKGTVFGAWDWDLSSTYGKDEVKFFTLDSINADLYALNGTSPTDFFGGVYLSSQLTNNLDVVREFEVGLVSPLSVAVGIEQRYENYQLKTGDLASRFGSGAQSFPGIQVGDSGSHGRHNYAFYADLATSPIKNLQVDIAGRLEYFTDFGSTLVGKLTSRYDFTPVVAVRGTISTGFRAPTLAESYYSATNVGPQSAFVQLPPNAAAAALLGLGSGLQPEESTNLSLGIVLHPTERLSATIDAYQIEIRDRIVGSGTLFSQFNGVPVPGAEAITAAIIANGNVLDPQVTDTGINIFANGLTTRTRGVDLVLSYPANYVWGAVDWSASANYNKTKVTKINASPAQLGGQSLFDAVALSDLETASPEYRFNFSGVWSLNRFTVTLRETIYGPSAEKEIGNDGSIFTNKIEVTPITDLELGFKATKKVKFSLGANNVFNVYPDQKNAALLQGYREGNNNSAVAIYPSSFAPFGYNGGYYYAKLGYTF